MPVRVEVKNLTKKFGGFIALDNLNVAIEPGELFFLLGPSGCGKTTLLRCIAGFHNPDAGRIYINDRDVTFLAAHKRNTGMVFQSYALWPHMTLAENVAFGLEARHANKSEIKQRVQRALDLVHLGERADVKPNVLSGGQQQRVALARALVIEPQCLLLDEPLSNLDAKLRVEMRVKIRRICKEVGLTAVYVTHDQKEALSIADRMAVMRDGVVEQIGTPEQIYRHPANRFTAGFIGEGNFFEGTVREIQQDHIVVECTLGTMISSTRCPELRTGDKIWVCIRPEAICFDGTETPNHLCGTLVESLYLGEIAQHTLTVNGETSHDSILKAFELNPRQSAARVGSAVEMWVEPECVIVTKA